MSEHPESVSEIGEHLDGASTGFQFVNSEGRWAPPRMAKSKTGQG
jgi:hypothetical protein